MTLAIGIDVGGTKLLGGIVDENGKILARIRKDTPKEGGVALTDRVADLVRELMAQSSSPITKVGLSAAGFVSADRQTMLAPPNIAGWTGVNLGKELKERLGLDVIVENDANAAATTTTASTPADTFPSKGVGVSCASFTSRSFNGLGQGP